MPTIQLITRIAAPIEEVFDLARSIDLHMESMTRYRETAIAGVVSGVIGPGQEVTWKARHFAITWRLTSRITGYDRPRWFRDGQVRGPFGRFDHDHFFPCDEGKTVLRDTFDFNSPLGLLGRAVDALVMTRYLARLLSERNALLKSTAERRHTARSITE